ncbi:hypothetical protein R1sor_021816 [Riccia sorocarpa]|uniref:Uncharacterized protein n=1 Tax=Riccia sorocarpa TaxID=122646 RepID=A0ABD3GL92_9MARC
MPTWEDDRSLVFAPLGDLEMAQQVHVAASVNGRKYPRVCGDFFTEMTMPERIAYNKKYYALGAPKDTDPAGRNAILLKDLIQSATHHHARMRNSAAQCFEVMSDHMKINPMTCSRPTETPSHQRRERTNMYEEYLNAERVNMAYGLAYHEMRQLGLLLPE